MRTFTSASVGMLFAAGMAFHGGRVTASYDRPRVADAINQNGFYSPPLTSQKYTELKQETITHAFVDHVYRGGAGAAFTSGGGGGGAARAESGTPTSPRANRSRAFLMFVLIWWCTAGSSN